MVHQFDVFMKALYILITNRNILTYGRVARGGRSGYKFVQISPKLGYFEGIPGNLKMTSLVVEVAHYEIRGQTKRLAFCVGCHTSRLPSQYQYLMKLMGDSRPRHELDKQTRPQQQ